jgi:hypothetical protein
MSEAENRLVKDGVKTAIAIQVRGAMSRGAD